MSLETIEEKIKQVELATNVEKLKSIKKETDTKENILRKVNDIKNEMQTLLFDVSIYSRESPIFFEQLFKDLCSIIDNKIANK